VWAEPLGTLNKVGMEGADGFGAGLRFPAGYGLAVIEVDRPGRAGRRRNGKSHPQGTESAVRRSGPRSSTSRTGKPTDRASAPPADDPSARSSNWTLTSPAAPATSPAPASSPRSSPRPPLERIWLDNNLPDWQPDHEHERELQAVRTATAVEDLLARKPGHVIVAGDFDADPAAASIRFWTGRQSLNGRSVCYRDAWESARPGEPGPTFVPGNPNSADWDWPYRRIDYILIRCARHGGPTLAVSSCERTFDHPASAISDHYGLVADLTLPPQSPKTQQTAGQLARGCGSPAGAR
jgi:hypothetical protein